MEKAIRIMNEKVVKEDNCTVYYFRFRRDDEWTNACVQWYVSEVTTYQNMTIEIEGGYDDQIKSLIDVYLEARIAANNFDVGGVYFLFERYALMQGITVTTD